MPAKRYILIRTFALAALLFSTLYFCTGCAGAAFAILFHHKLKQADMLEDWNKTDGTLIKNIIYDPEKNFSCDLYLPKDIQENSRRDVMLFIHGGAWNSGRKEDMAYACRRYAKEGYITVTLQYSLASKKGPPITFFTILDDITRCLTHIKTYTAERGITVKKLALSGYSAGGHLAMLYAFSRKNECPIPIAFVFSQVGPSIFTRDAWGEKKKDFALALASAASGQTITEKNYDSIQARNAIKSISPALLIDNHTVPGIYAYGGKDPLVTPFHARALKQALQKHHIPHDILIYPESGHFLCEDPEYTRKFRALVREYCQKYFL